MARVQQLAATHTRIDDETLEQLEEILLGADVGPATTTEILRRLKERARTEGFDSSDRLSELLKDEVARLLHVDGEPAPLPILPTSQRPLVIMVVGVNGVGKTTTIGKLAWQYRQAGKRVVIGAADTFRAAAKEQLDIWAQRAGAEIAGQSQSADPASVAFEALNTGVAHDADVVIVDTAGRLHTKLNLMEELKKIRRVMDKRLPGAPHEVLLVLDATTGQNGLQQVRMFTDAVQVTGLVLTKLDGTAKGGIVIAVSHDLGIPVRFIGVGEAIDDLQPFDRRAFIDALFDQSPSGGSSE